MVLPTFVLVPGFAWRYRRTNNKAAYRPDWAFSWSLEFAIWGIPCLIVGPLAFLIISEETRFDPYAAIRSDQPSLERVNFDSNEVFLRLGVF